MSLETEIREAFDRHATDVAPGPGTWTSIQHRITRRHRLRMAGSILGAAAAIAAIAVVAPFLLDRDVELPTTPTGWKAVSPTDGGFTLSYPPDWIAGGVDRGVQITPPGPPTGPEGKLSFSLSAYLSDQPYDNPDVTTNAARTEGEIDGHPFVRYERIAGQDALDRHVVVYLMPWEGPPIQCPQDGPCAQPTYELQISIVARFPDDWDRYAPTAERIVRTVEPMPSQTPPPVPTLQAKIKVQASFLAAGQDAIWAITQRSGGEGAFLSKIDPATNRIVGSVDVGLAPVGVAADSNGVWVANGSGCAIAYGCSQGGEVPPPTPQYPLEESVWRIDPDTLHVEARIRVAGPSAIAAGTEGVWVASYGSGNGTSILRQIDPATNSVVREIAIEGDGPINVATGEGNVWVTSAAPGSDGESGILSVIDPSAGKVVATSGFGTPGGPSDIAAGEGAAWATSGHRVLRTNDAKKVDVVITVDDASPVSLNSIATGEGYVWVVGGRGVLWKIDPPKNAVIGEGITIGDNPPVGAGDVVVGFGSVWVASGDGQIWRIAP